MKEVILDPITENPPTIIPMGWNEYSLTKWLMKQGFDFSKEIQRMDNLATGNIHFRQEE